MAENGFLAKLFGRNTTDDADDLIEDRAVVPKDKQPPKKGKDKKDKGAKRPIRPDVYDGINVFYEVARKDESDPEYWLPATYRAKLAKNLGDDPAADIDDFIASRLESGTLKLVVKYLDADGLPVRTVDVPEHLVTAMLGDFNRQNDEADETYKAALAKYKGDHSGKPAETAPAEEFELTDEILALVATMDPEDKRAFVAGIKGLKPLDRAKLLAAKPKDDPDAESGSST